MKKVGKQVLFMATGQDSARNGEATFIRLKDGRILFAFTQYYGGDYEDDGIARICACYSSDEGETWSEPSVLLEKDPEAKNYMSPSLFRLPDGDLGMVLDRKVVVDGVTCCMPVFVRSADEGKSWAPFYQLPIELGYYGIVNDCVLVCRSGRILVPFYGAAIQLFCSDDSGKSWSLLPVALKPTYEGPFTFHEPGIFEHADGKLWLYFRSVYGFQYHSVSEDGGVTWSSPEPNLCFPSAESPMRVKTVGDFVVAISNPASYGVARPLLEKREGWGSPRRTPLVCAFDTEDGRSFSRRGICVNGDYLKQIVDQTVCLEDDPEDSYCYPAIQEVEGGFLVAYYHSNGSDFCLNSTKMIKIAYEELEADGC